MPHTRWPSLSDRWFQTLFPIAPMGAIAEDAQSHCKNLHAFAHKRHGSHRLSTHRESCQLSRSAHWPIYSRHHNSSSHHKLWQKISTIAAHRIVILENLFVFFSVMCMHELRERHLHIFSPWNLAFRWYYTTRRMACLALFIPSRAPEYSAISLCFMFHGVTVTALCSEVCTLIRVVDRICIIISFSPWLAQ